MLRGSTGISEERGRFNRGAPTNSRTVNPWVVQVALSALNEKDLEIMVEVGQPDIDSVT